MRSVSCLLATLCAGLPILGCDTGAGPPPTVASVVVAPATVSLTALGDTARVTAHASDARGKAVAGASLVWSSSAEGVATVNTSGLVTAVANGVAIITATSDGVTGHAAVTVAQAVTSVAVTPPTVALNAVGQTVQLSAAASDANGHPVAGPTFAWASSAETIATVSASGLVTAVAGGSATVSATASGRSGNAAVTVVQLAASITLTPPTASLSALGGTVQLTAAASDANGHAIAGKTFTWSSSQEGVATVSASGLVTAVGNGATTISAMADGVGASASVTVAQQLASVAVTPAAPSLDALGATVQLAAEARDANGHTIGGRAFTWASSDESVATVHASGLVTAAANGTAAIRASTGGVQGSTPVTVAQKAATVALSPAGAWVSGVGATKDFTVEAWDVGGSPIPGDWITPTWTSLNPNVATVDPAVGRASGVGAGQVTIQVDVDGLVEYALLTVQTPGLSRVNLWAEMESGVPDLIYTAWGTSATDVFAAAGGPTLHYDGTNWTTTFSEIGLLQMDVWGSSGSDVYTVGNGGKVLHYNGGFWSLEADGMCNMLSAAWGASPRDVFGVCWDGTLVRYDGLDWTTMESPVPGAALYDVWGTSANDVYAVGGNRAFHFDGDSWSDISAPVLGFGIENVWGFSENELYAAFLGNVFRYDGARWTWIAYDAPIVIWSVWGSSNTDMYFAGADTLGRAAVLHYDGTGWRMMSSAIPQAIHGVWGAPTGEVFGVGGGGTILRGYRGGSVAVSPSSATLTGNANRTQLVASAAAGGSPVTGVSFLWTSSNETIATVDEDGWVTGLAEGTAAIRATAFGGATATATVTVILTQKPPVARIDSPSKDTILTLGESVTFQGAASDPDGTIASHVWDFGDGSGASVEDPGPYTYGDTGSYKVTYRVTDNDGASSPLASVLVRVVLNQSPTATISSPADQATYAPGVPVTFSGSGADHEDGALTGASLVWTSSRDGQIGSGASFTRADLSEGTHTINLTATDSEGASGAANVSIKVQAQTPLYLRYIDSKNVLSNEASTTNTTTITLYNYGSGQSVEFQASLESSITGSAYGFSLWLGAGNASGQTGSWTASLLLEHGGVQATLATHTFAVPFGTNFVEYNADVTGTPGGAPGDKLVLRLTLANVSVGAVRFGPAPLDSHILVPGGVTVSPLTSPSAAQAAEAAGVKVEVTAVQDLRYRGGS